MIAALRTRGGGGCASKPQAPAPVPATESAKALVQASHATRPAPDSAIEKEADALPSVGISFAAAFGQLAKAYAEAGAEDPTAFLLAELQRIQKPPQPSKPQLLLQSWSQADEADSGIKREMVEKIRSSFDNLFISTETPSAADTAPPAAPRALSTGSGAPIGHHLGATALPPLPPRCTRVPPLSTSELFELPKTIREEDLLKWDIDLYGLQSARELMAVAASIFRLSGVLERFDVPPPTLAAFLAECASRYPPNTYHNFNHGVHVLHGASVLVRGGAGEHCTALSPLQVFALLVASIGHDVEHPGVTNAFLIKSGSPLALRYNDRSVLENHHAATTFAILAMPSCDLFASLSPEQRLEARSIMLSAIFATDMAHHHAMVTDLNRHADSPGSTPLLPSEVAAAFCHIADLANVALRWDLAEKWAEGVGKEAVAEFKEMVRIGLPLPVFAQLKPYTRDELVARQLVFADGWVHPLYSAAARLFPAVADRLAVLDVNRVACKSVHKEAARQRLRDKVKTVVAFKRASTTGTLLKAAREFAAAPAPGTEVTA